MNCERKRDSREESGKRGHKDRAKAQQRSAVNGFLGRLALFALCLQREVNNHDAVLLDDADQQNNTNDPDNAKVLPEQNQSQQGSDARRGQRGENRKRMDVALVQNAKHDVDGDKRGENQ